MDPFTANYSEFQGIPQRTLADDTIEYSIYILYGPQSKLRARLEEVADMADKLVQEWGMEYIWQREAFALQVIDSEGT